ncbi:unnamed protein product [Alternaria alternata]
MSHSDFAKDTTVARTPGRDEHATSPSTKSHTPKNPASSKTSKLKMIAPLYPDQRPSIHHTWSRNTGHSWPGDKEDAITTVTTSATQDPRFEVDYEEGEDPEEWPMLRKALVVFFMSFSTLVVVMYSTSYTSGIPGMMETFGIRSKTLVILGITTYLCGLAIGSLLLAPLSEMYGRRPVYLIAVALFTVLIIPCALSNNLAQILVMRFFGAIAGAAMISNAPGTVSDISKEDYRALAFSIWSLGPMNGPVIGPLIGGFVFQALGWRWTNWVVMIGSGTSWFMVFMIPETYKPAILRAKSANKRKETSDSRYHSRYDEKKAFWPLLRENLYRPLSMAVNEPICIFWDVYIALVYGVLYLCFVSYPIVFGELRGWSPGLVGLGYMGIGIGGVITIASEPLLRRMINSHKKDPETGKPYPEAMVSVVVIAAVCVPVGEMIFACATMLSLIEFALIPIPVVFYLYGHKIREKSALIRQMREDRERVDAKKRKAVERAERAKGGFVDEKKLEV